MAYHCLENCGLTKESVKATPLLEAPAGLNLCSQENVFGLEFHSEKLTSNELGQITPICPDHNPVGVPLEIDLETTHNCVMRPNLINYCYEYTVIRDEMFSGSALESH